MSNDKQEEKKEEKGQEEDDSLDSLSKEELVKKVKENHAKKKHWREKAQKGQEEDQEKSTNDSNTQKVDPNEINQLKEKVNKVERSEQKRNFQHKHGLSPKQVDFLFRKSDGDPEDEMDDPAMKAALNEIESQEKVEDNTPSSSSTRFRTSVDSDKDYSEMSSEEKEEAYRKRQKKRGIL